MSTKIAHQRAFLFLRRTLLYLTGLHMRMARAALGWSVAETAEKTGVSVSTIKRAETSSGVPNVMASNLEALQRTFEAHNLGFQFGDEPGVFKRITAEGHAQFPTFRSRGDVKTAGIAPSPNAPQAPGIKPPKDG